jgi:hypothetical protein
VRAKALSAIVFAQLFLLGSTAWADDGPGTNRPHISDVGGDVHSPGVTFVIFLTLVLIGFGVGFIVGRKTRRK